VIKFIHRRIAGSGWAELADSVQLCKWDVLIHSWPEQMQIF
jgi:hypothetical protein